MGFETGQGLRLTRFGNGVWDGVCDVGWEPSEHRVATRLQNKIGDGGGPPRTGGPWDELPFGCGVFDWAMDNFTNVVGARGLEWGLRCGVGSRWTQRWDSVPDGHGVGVWDPWECFISSQVLHGCSTMDAPERCMVCQSTQHVIKSGAMPPQWHLLWSRSFPYIYTIFASLFAASMHRSGESQLMVSRRPAAIRPRSFELCFVYRANLKDLRKIINSWHKVLLSARKKNRMQKKLIIGFMAYAKMGSAKKSPK